MAAGRGRYGVGVSSNLYERRDMSEEILLSPEGEQYLRDNPTASIALERVIAEGFASMAEFNLDRRRHPEKYPTWLRLPVPSDTAD
jgi:hypothetical protein